MLGLIGPNSFPWGVVLLMAPVLIVVIAARAHGFPAKRPGMEA
jgi:hypothetical protein